MTRQVRFVLISIIAFCFSDPLRAEMLYNGIKLPEPWPPRYSVVPSREPMPVPYLHNIPQVIPIDVGHQLFVDDFLIEPTELRRTHHPAEYYPENPVLKPDKPWESDARPGKEPTPMALVFSDGVWFDHSDRLFKMWYMGGYERYTCLATSEDGVHWNKPDFGVVANTNIVSTLVRDSGTVWMDLFDADPERRFKIFLYEPPYENKTQSLYFSRDGIHWSDRVANTGPTDDRATAFYNPFRKGWVFGVKDSTYGRRRLYWEHSDPIQLANWKKGEPYPWVGADRLDRKWEEFPYHPQLYNLDAVAYESLMLGLFTIWPGPGGGGRPKPNQIYVGYSRDGFHWHRPFREPFVPDSDTPGAWNYGNVQSAGGCCLVVGDKLYFYVSGRAGVPGSDSVASGVCATGLATLRRDGFASLDAGEKEDSVTTRPLTFKGSHLFVNVDAPEGELRVELLDENRKPIEPYTLENATPIKADSTLQRVEWKSADDLGAFARKPVRFRFHLKNGSLYSFWVSPDENGASHGYVAASGPGFTGPTDTMGEASLRRGSE